MPDDLSHFPEVLYRASIARIEAARRCWRAEDYSLAAYLGGLAVECILQAIALRHDPRHDARHDLAAWMRKCPQGFQDDVASEPTRGYWNSLVATWHNRLRYYDYGALLGELRKRPDWRRYRGDDDARMRRAVREMVDSAERIHTKGVTQWRRSKR